MEVVASAAVVERISAAAAKGRERHAKPPAMRHGPSRRSTAARDNKAGGHGMVLGAPSFVPTQWTMYWQAGCAWVSVTVASSPLTVNCPVMVTVKVETVVGSVEKWAVLSIVPEALIPTCWIESVPAPGVCVTVVGLF